MRSAYQLLVSAHKAPIICNFIVSAGMNSEAESGGTWSLRAKGALLKTVVLLVTFGIIFESLHNTLTWYASKFWGGAGDTWQEMWTYFLDTVRADFCNQFYKSDVHIQLLTTESYF